MSDQMGKKQVHEESNSPNLRTHTLQLRETYVLLARRLSNIDNILEHALTTKNILIFDKISRDHRLAQGWLEQLVS